MITKKLFIFIISLFFIFLSFEVYSLSTHLSVADITHLQTDQDSTGLKIEQPDTSDIDRDSLEKILPYLDDVEGDSKNEILLVLMLVIILSTLISEDLTCIGAGVMVANGLIAFWPASAAAIIGIYLGDFTLYFAGRLLGTSILEVAPFKWFIKKEDVEKTVEWFKYKGPVMLVASRFIPGSRVPVYLSAGILRTSFWQFFLYFGVTTLLWTPIFVWISVIAGGEILNFYEAYDDYAIWIISGIVILLWIVFRFVKPLFTKRGRRIFVKWIRKIFS